MKGIKRIAVIFLVLNLVKPFQICNDDPETNTFFNFNTMSVSNIDN